MPYILEHFKNGTFEEEYWLPAHNERRESALFKSNKKFVRDTCGAPCWVCGATKKLEVHHVFEWAFWNAMDPRKVSNILKAVEFYDEDYVATAKYPDKIHARLDELERQKPIIDTPDDLRNLVVLCLEHHRTKFMGIHTISFPTWLAVSAVPTDGGIMSKEQVMIAAQRVQALDQELAAMAGNNYEPHRT